MKYHFYLFSVFYFLCGFTVLISQGLPKSGEAKLLVIYSDINNSEGFSFDTNDLSEKLNDFYYQMSLGKLNLNVKSIKIDISKPEMFFNYKEAVLYIMEKVEEKLNLEEFSIHADKSILDGICIVFDSFYEGWKDNPAWSGIATITIDNQNRKFDNKILQKSEEPGKSSGIIMRASNGLNYSFWILAHEVGHLFGLKHMPINEQNPYYQLMNTTGDMWGINRGMAFWEREAVGWVKPDIKLDLTDYSGGKDSTSFYLQDYMSTGHYAKIILPKNEYYSYGKIKLNNDNEIYFENRMKISPYDQDKQKGDEGIFLWSAIGKLVLADGKSEFSYYPSNDAFGAPNHYSDEYEFNYYYSRINMFNPDQGYSLQNYSIPIKMKFNKDNRINIIYGPEIATENKYHLTSKDRTPKIERLTNFPNPFNSQTKISFFLNINIKITLEIFNSLGEKVSVMVDDYLDGGDYSFDFDATNLPTGIYFYRIMTPNGKISNANYRVFTGKMLYIK